MVAAVALVASKCSSLTSASHNVITQDKANICSEQSAIMNQPPFTTLGSHLAERVHVPEICQKE